MLAKWVNRKIKPKLINLGKPPALPERLPEFDNSGSISKPPRIEPLKVQKGGLQ
jgi:hypothetical protein